MTVYCESCKMCICHVCALFGGNHSDHKFKPLEDLYKGVIDKLNLEVTSLLYALHFDSWLSIMAVASPPEGPHERGPQQCTDH